MSTDTEWEKWGAKDPYFAVLTDPKFRSADLTPEAKEEFFATGCVHARYVLETCRRYLDPLFTPQRVLDFGCGVGRLLLPFAELAQEVVGMDISRSMLAQARLNCQERNVSNVLLVASDDALSTADGQFDLVHTCIVLQHIEIRRGRAIFAALVQRIRPGGCGALHVTFAWDAHAATFGQPPLSPPAQPPGPIALATATLKQWVGPPQPAPAAPLLGGDPEMQMNFYNLSELMFLLQQAGITCVHTEITDHGGALGAFLFFQKPM